MRFYQSQIGRLSSYTEQSKPAANSSYVVCTNVINATTVSSLHELIIYGAAAQ